MAIQKLLVANRGEIAVRILRAATELGIRTVAIYSHEDRFALHRYKADEAYKLGCEGDPIGSYLNHEAILDLCRQHEVDAIHPGYGFLSENAEFAQKCKDAGVTFVGPGVEILEHFGDKVKARAVAVSAEVPVIPGSDGPIDSVDEALSFSKQIGFPVTLKAVSGGGGKGIRMIASPSELKEAFERAKSEAQTSFGRADIYIEKKIERPRHIEVQIVGDSQGNIVHLFERDCSIQRRHQKVVEVAPAVGLKQDVRERLWQYATRIAEHVNYVGLGTVEFLVDAHDEIYFLEVNPRIQVEHTVTEMITGIDLVQASILISAGTSLSDTIIGIEDQASIEQRGAAIQCRITTEDPLNQFAPDTGRIIAYRPACGFGIRLDEGHGTAGGVVTPHYDSLLVKVTSWAKTLEAASAKMHRSLSEFRIRGIKHNIPLLKNVVRHPSFLQADLDTSFFESHPEVFDLKLPRDRATKMLRYIADVTVNNPHGLPQSEPRGESEPPDLRAPGCAGGERKPNAKEVFDSGGVEGLKAWLKERNSLQVTDTTMRDAHQSLFATRMRTIDMLKAAPFYRDHVQQFFSLEVWGGATFDTCLRFLKEDPWRRLSKLREAIPNQLLQMLLRGDNAVGYTNYPEWVIRDFIKETVDAGLDLFRIFDCLNQPNKMAIAIDEVKKRGGIAECCICYTGNVVDPQETKFTLPYYISLARELETMGADILCIKDMAGLLRPKAAEVLVRALKENTDLPIHLHTHATSGASVPTLLEAAKAGCDIVDGAISSMSGLTSQPSINALVAAMGGDPRCPQIELSLLDELARYWDVVRGMYADFDPGIRATSTDVYDHEIPGGQYSNLYEQARRVGVSAKEFYELTKRYKEVNDLLGNIIKVTPSSKVVGDFALLLQKNQLTGPQLLDQRPNLDYPDSVVSFFRGEMGEPYGGVPESVREIVLKGEKPQHENLGQNDAQDTFDKARTELSKLKDGEILDRDVVSYRLYPKVYKDFLAHRSEFGSVSGLNTPVFFYGLKQGQEIETDLERGKTLVISLEGVSDPDDVGKRTVFFKLNGFTRAIDIIDASTGGGAPARAKADPLVEGQVGASMPGKVLEVHVVAGRDVNVGDKLLVTESMKMEYVVTAKVAGTVGQVSVGVGDLVEEGDLLVNIS